MILSDKIKFYQYVSYMQFLFLNFVLKEFKNSTIIKIEKIKNRKIPKRDTIIQIDTIKFYHFVSYFQMKIFFR